ncbi:hypothetical protein [Halohasta litorea]|uniref:Uncharacterized protein n=1 Tax=Halohasta litorea TaxID=869891 RepID=A0ABD6D9U3_9EURY|nr:hypothetical protein [Halohasta litorea]
MDAEIKKETDDGFGVLVNDNNGAAHKIGVCYNGEIDGHLCDAYADKPINRTSDENEHNEQARRYAKYYVYRERGYDTVDHIDNPDYIEAVRQAIRSLSDERFEQLFGPLYTQLQSHHKDVGRPIDLPARVQKPDAVVYKLELYLGVDIADSGLTDQARSLAEAHGLDYETGTTTQTGAVVGENERQNWAEFGEHLTDLTDPDDIELELSAVSGIHVGYPNSRGEHEVQWADRPLDREPDARLELMPTDPGPIDDFGQYLDYHLRCQVRDCVVGMGLLPPEPYRVLGFGKFRYARRYDQYDLYPQLHLRDGNHDMTIQ